MTAHEAGVRARQPQAKYRVVKAGDTLYSIAWESGRDFRDLAGWNDIAPPYLIKPGQRLRLYAPPPAHKPAARASSYHIVAKGETLYGIARNAGVNPYDLAAWNNVAPPYLLQPGQQLRLSATEAEAGAPKTIASPPPRSPGDTTTQSAVLAWMWPTDGTILERYAANGPNKGIDIGGNHGQPIRAAAPGRVVYEGSGLRGYGKLIIIKHNADFLSAYAHCATTYVKEGNAIKPGQKIADMGNSGTDRVKLHFEIRRDGVPVDPIDYLPKK